MRDPWSVALGVVLSLGGVACSSSGGDAASADAGGAETGKTADYCAAEKTYFDRCPPPEATAECKADITATCGEREAFYSEGFAAVVAACVDVPCERSLLGSPCAISRLKAQTPTAAQQRLADELCMACAKVASTREEGLSCPGHVITGTGRLLGPYILSLSDRAAERVRTSCVEPAGLQFPDDYNNCENVFFNCIAGQAEEPASCK